MRVDGGVRSPSGRMSPKAAKCNLSIARHRRAASSGAAPVRARDSIRPEGDRTPPSQRSFYLDSAAMGQADRERLEGTTRYDPAEVETRVFAEWMEGGYFHPEAEGTPEENFSVAVVPPNHTVPEQIEHALDGSNLDALG